MARTTLYAAVLTILVFSTGCYPLKTGTFTNTETVSLDRYQTYSWVDETKSQSGVEGELLDSVRLDNWVRESVDGNMKQRGLRLVSTDEAQLLFAYYFFLQEDIEETHNSAPYANEWYQKGIYVQGANIVSKMRGTLYINIVEVRSEESIWLGWGERKMKAKFLGKSAIQDAVTKILDQL